MSIEIDEAYKRFIGLMPELAEAAKEPINEADTRFKILDRILLEVLGWPHDQVETEASAAEGFVDYTLKALDGRPLSIIEAKRVGQLDLKTASTKQSSLVLSGRILRPLRAPIQQAVGYAALQSVSTACVTDGRVWLFLQTNRRDVPLMEGKAILFPSLASVAAEFPRFHDLLSRSGIQNRLGLVQLNRADGIRAAFEEEQITVSPPDEARMLPRDALSHDASLLFSQFFAGISAESDPEMLRACFVETPESNKADLELQKIAQKLLNGIEALDTGHSAALQSEVERAVTSMRSETVLIVGNKGSGKTTFLTRFFADVLSNQLRKQCVIVRVSLDAVADQEKEGLSAWVTRQIRDQLENQLCAGDSPTFDELRGIFFSDYQRLSTGSLKPLYDKDRDEFRIQFGQRLEKMRDEEPENYVRAFLERAVSNDRKLPVIIFDNADQFPAATQDAMFQMAHAFSLITAVLTIVPITDRTVWRLSKTGALQSYPAKSFYLPVPEAKKILRKRIDYVTSKLNEDPQLAQDYFSARGFRVKLQNIDRFAQAVERIFVTNDFVSGLIGRLANFDIRRMLLIAERIFLSPEIRIDEVLKGSFGFNPGKGEQLRIHRAIIKGEYDRYSDRENSYISNLFWTDRSWPSSPLLALYILWTLRTRLAKAKADNVDTRHWGANELGQFFEPLGAHPEQTIVVLQRLADRGLVEALDPTVDLVSPVARMAVTESGIAHMDLTFTSDVYVEQMAMATGLNSRSTVNMIRDDRTGATGSSFTAMKKHFVDYLVDLDSQRFKIPNTKEYAGLSEARNLLKSLSSTASRDIDVATARSGRTSPADSIGGVFRRGR